MSKAIICLALVVIAATAGCGTSTGSKVDIGGRNLYIDCRGEGNPTVILEAGLTSDTTWWDDVIDPIAGFTRVCAYDRANNGRSDEVGLHSGDQSVSDLEKLLSAKKIEPPYVLVGWSFGGPISRLYAARHPVDVTGMVLVDTDPTDYRSEGDTRSSRRTSVRSPTGPARTTRSWTSMPPSISCARRARRARSTTICS